LNHTLTEKLIARAAGKSDVAPGEIVNVRVDRLLINDLLGPIVFGQFESLGAEAVWAPDRVMFGIDHRVPPAEVQLANNLKFCRDKCREYGISRFAEIGRHGIGHQLMSEGFVRPGEIAVGTDSHATMYGGLGAFACGITSSDAAVILASGEIWFQVPSSVKINIAGMLGQCVTAKDIMLKMLTLAPLEQFIYKAVEIEGAAIRKLSVSGRLVICNMVAEMGAKNAIIAADERTAEYLKVKPDEIVCDRSDPEARYEKVYALNITNLQPLVACPHQVNNVVEVEKVRGTPIHQAFLGSCTNGRIEDLQQAVEILKGRKVHPNVRLIVVPASQEVLIEATRLGLTEALLESGAAIMTPSCAACAGNGPGVLAAGETCISTTNRNFKGRMGSPDSGVYLASAYTVAASAVAGVIEDPRKFF